MTALNVVDNIKEAQILIENDVGDFCCPIVFTDSSCKAAPYTYEYKSINKACGVAMYVQRKHLIMANPYIEKNLYRLNYNGELFKLTVYKCQPKKREAISVLWNSYKDHRLVIVGGGESWTKIDWKRKATDIMVMIVNYNFKLKANFVIFNDKQVGRDLECVEFNDERIMIGFSDHVNKASDFVYSNDDIVAVGHTGAAAVQLSEKMGFKKIYIAGFDYNKNSNGKDQVYLKDKNDYYKDSRCDRFVADYEKFKTERTYNLNKKSRLQSLPFASMDELYEV